jgi:hypothetical protein
MLLVWMLLGNALALDPEARSAILFEERVDAETPDERTALTLSTAIGFGAGHFYSRRPDAGMAFAGTQGLGLLLGGVTLAMFLDEQADGPAVDTEEAQDAHARRLTSYFVVGSIGVSIAFGSRVIDAASAPGSARAEALEVVDEYEQGQR